MLLFSLKDKAHFNSVASLSLSENPGQGGSYSSSVTGKNEITHAQWITLGLCLMIKLKVLAVRELSPMVK